MTERTRTAGRTFRSAGKPKERMDPRIAQTRAQVFRATLEVIAEHGIPQATVERIAERSGVARSTIYRRWPNLATLYYEAFAQVARRSSPPARGDTGAELRIYLDDYAERLNDHDYCSVMISLLDAAWRDPELAKIRKELFSERTSRVAAILAVGIRVGTIRPDVDITEAMDAAEAPFLYRRIVDDKLITKRDIDRLHADFMARFGTGLASEAG